MSWMVILVGPASVGKTSLVQLLAHLTGHTLKIMAMNSAMDTTELLGGFEQVPGYSFTLTGVTYYNLWSGHGGFCTGDDCVQQYPLTEANRFGVLWKFQVDIIRPWRLLLEKVERAVRVLLRDSLLINADDTEVVLRAWSHFLLTYRPKCLGEDGKGVTIEIVNKLEAVLLLLQRLNNKINSYSKAGMSI